MKLLGFALPERPYSNAALPEATLAFDAHRVAGGMAQVRQSADRVTSPE